MYFNTTDNATKLYSEGEWGDLGGGWDGVIPNYTTAQRNDLSLVDGLIVYNTTDDAVQIYVSGVWRNVGAKLSSGIVCSLDGDCDSTHCIDGNCCNTTCIGNCNRCNVEGSLGTCTDVNSDCTGNCDICSSGNCVANASLCTGNCDECSEVSATVFNCSADVASCTGNCDQCTGSGTVFDCASNVALCTGNCDQCTGSGTVYDCSALASLCTGNCDICSGSGAVYNCAASNALCSNTTASCNCSGSGTVFNCQACATCTECSSYSCSVGKTTNWGQNLYACTGTDKRCYSGSCKTCSGYGYMLSVFNDAGNYWGGMCTGGTGYSCCWRFSSPGLSCNTICSSFGGCLAGNWHGGANNPYCSEKCCHEGTDSYLPGCVSSLGYYWGKRRTSSAAYPQDCAASAAGVYRACICQY